MVKATVSVDDTVWEEFKRSVVQRRGSLKKLSEEVEEAIKGFAATALLAEVSERLGVRITGFPSLADVKKRRIRSGLSTGAIIREIRDEKAKRVSRLE